MSSQFRIPTVLGLGILVFGLAAGVFLASQNQVLKSRASQESTPKNLAVANISATSASIYWETDIETTGFVQAGEDTSLDLTINDERDLNQPLKHKVHFASLTNLSPNTTYYFKVNSGSVIFPAGEPLSFETSETFTPVSIQPLIGTVVDSTLKPVTEALITLEISGLEKLATVTKIGGNFILPLSSISQTRWIQNLDQGEGSINGKLNISAADQKSVITLKIPPADLTLPPITLGKDLDLTTFTASPSGPLKNESDKYDLNKDGVINSLDRSIVLKNLGKKTYSKEVDLNEDGQINQKDLEIINRAVPNSAR